jgi:Flp pilus assembly protein TadD
MNDVPLSTAGRDALLRRVRAALGDDNLPLAESLAREILRVEPSDGVAWAVLAHIAALIGRDREAARWRRQASAEVLSRFDPPTRPRVREILEGCGP